MGKFNYDIKNYFCNQYYVYIQINNISIITKHINNYIEKITLLFWESFIKLKILNVNKFLIIFKTIYKYYINMLFNWSIPIISKSIHYNLNLK